MSPGRISSWLRSKPGESDLFGTNVRLTWRKFLAFGLRRRRSTCRKTGHEMNPIDLAIIAIKAGALNREALCDSTSERPRCGRRLVFRFSAKAIGPSAP